MACGHKDATPSKYLLWESGSRIITVTQGGVLLLHMIDTPYPLHTLRRSSSYIYKVFWHLIMRLLLISMHVTLTLTWDWDLLSVSVSVDVEAQGQGQISWDYYHSSRCLNTFYIDESIVHSYVVHIPHNVNVVSLIQIQLLTWPGSVCVRRC